MPIQQMFLGAGGGSAPESFEYFYNGSTSTTITVPGAVSFFKVAGVAAGSSGQGPGSPTGGSSAGGGGAGNLAGYEVPPATVSGQTIYIGTSPNGPTYIKTGSHSGTSIWEAGAGSVTAGGSMLAGPGNSGGAGGGAGGRYNPGGAGANATNAGSGGGGGGGHSDGDGGSGSGRPGGPGGTTSISSAITPLGVGPAPAWSITGTPGGGGGSSQQAGGSAPTGGAGGGSQPGGWPSSANGGSGGGGGGVVIYGSSYGGGGGGVGANHPTGSGTGGSGKGGFIILQMTY